MDPRQTRAGMTEKKLGLVIDSKDLRTKPQKGGLTGPLYEPGQARVAMLQHGVLGCKDNVRCTWQKSGE